MNFKPEPEALLVVLQAVGSVAGSRSFFLNCARKHRPHDASRSRLKGAGCRGCRGMACTGILSRTPWVRRC